MPDGRFGAIHLVSLRACSQSKGIPIAMSGFDQTRGPLANPAAVKS
jgi:hypothetical protein